MHTKSRSVPSPTRSIRASFWSIGSSKRNSLSAPSTVWRTSTLRSCSSNRHHPPLSVDFNYRARLESLCTQIVDQRCVRGIYQEHEDEEANNVSHAVLAEVVENDVDISSDPMQCARGTRAANSSVGWKIHVERRKTTTMRRIPSRVILCGSSKPSNAGASCPRGVSAC